MSEEPYSVCAHLTQEQFVRHLSDSICSPISESRKEESRCGTLGMPTLTRRRVLRMLTLKSGRLPISTISNTCYLHYLAEFGHLISQLGAINNDVIVSL